MRRHDGDENRRPHRQFGEHEEGLGRQQMGAGQHGYDFARRGEEALIARSFPTHDAPFGGDDVYRTRRWHSEGGHGRGFHDHEQAPFGTHPVANRDFFTEREEPSLRDRKGPKGYVRSGERIREDLCEQLIRALDVEVHEVSVMVSAGRVTLEGTVPQRRMKHRIEDIAESCFGVSEVDNRVRVHREGGSTLPTAPDAG